MSLWEVWDSLNDRNIVEYLTGVRPRSLSEWSNEEGSESDSHSYDGCYDDYCSDDSDDGEMERLDRQTKQPIFAAIKEGKLKDVKLLIESPVISLEMCYECISYAVSCNQTEAAKLILQRKSLALGDLTPIHRSLSGGIDAIGLTSDKTRHCPASEFPEKLMALATDKGESKVVKFLLSAGVNVHSTLFYSNTSVHVAVHKQYTQIVEHLLINGADVNSRYPEILKCTLLHRAVEKRNETIVKLLINYGAEINATREDGLTALHVAAQQGFVEIARCLIQGGACIDCVIIPSSKAEPYFSWAKEMNRKVQVDAPVETEGYSPLQLAVQNCHAEVVQLLLENDAAIISNSEDINRSTLFFDSVRGNFFDIIKLLLECGGDVNKKYDGPDNFFQLNSSLLHVAVANKNKAIVKLLMDFKANPNVQNNDGITPILFALKASESEIALFLLEYGANVENDELSLFVAVSNCTADVVQIILDKGIDVNQKISLERANELSSRFPYLFDNDFHEAYHYKTYSNFRASNLENYTPLLMAVRKGHFKTVELLLKKGAEISTSSKIGNVVLNGAAEGGHQEIAELLLKYGAQITADPRSGTCSLLSIAAHKGHWKFVEVLLLKLGATQVEKSWPGTLRLIMHKAIDVSYREKSLKVLKLILSSGADFELTQLEQTRMLSTAVEKNSERLAEILLDNKPKTLENHQDYSMSFLKTAEKGNYRIMERFLKSIPSIHTVKNHRQETALHIAAEHGRTNIVKILLKNGASVDCKRNDGQTPLLISASKGYLSIVEILLQSGAKVDLRDVDGRSPIYNASEKGRIQVVKLLLKSGAKPNIATKIGDTALSIAAYKGYSAIIEALIKFKAAIDSPNRGRETPLFKASRKGHFKIVRRLLKLGAAANFKTRENKTPLFIAASIGHLEVIKVLLKSGATVNLPNNEEESPLYNAVQNGHQKIVNLLLKNGASIEAENSYGTTPLSVAVRQNHLSIVRGLLRLGANADSADKEGRTPIHHTVSWHGDDDPGKMAEMTVLLLKHGVDINSQDHQLQTPLIVCAQQCRSDEIFETLLEYGAKTSVQDKKGKTALHYAAAKKRGIKRVKLLLESGVNVDTKDNKGCTPLFRAVGNQALENVEALLEAGADINVRDCKGISLLEFFVKNNLNMICLSDDSEILKMLLNYGADISTQFIIDWKKTISNDYSGQYNTVNRYLIAALEVNPQVNRKVQLEAKNICDSSQMTFRNECKAELSRMKREIIGDTNTTFYEFLTRNWRELASFIKNGAALDALKANAYKLKFPIYTDQINVQIQKAELGQNLMKQGIKHGWCLFHHYADVPYDILEKILDYLSIKDLRMLILVGQAIEANLQGKLSRSLSLEEINLFEP